jgi:hypothetical protein
VLYRKKTGYNEKEGLENLPPPLAGLDEGLLQFSLPRSRLDGESL